MVEQMIKLRKALDDAGIEWWDKSDNRMDRTEFRVNGDLWSVINGYGSYGGYENDGRVNMGLLELLATWVNDGDPIGYLSVDDVMVFVQRAICGKEAVDDDGTDIQGRVKGKWLTEVYEYGKDEEEDKWVVCPAEDGDAAYCSLCGKNALLDGGEDYVLSPYCPHCGAYMVTDMKGEEQ